MAELEIAHTDAVVRMVTTRNVQVNVWSNAPTVESIRAFGRIGVAHARRYPQGTGLLNLIVGGGTPSFSERVREEVVKLMKAREAFRLGSAHLILSRGFNGTAVRAFLSTAILLGRPLAPHKVFSETEAAAAWLAPLLGAGAEPWSRAELTALVQQIAET
jgi:hypothetical protein